MYKLFAFVAIALLVSPAIQDFVNFDEFNIVQNTLNVKIANNGSFTKFILTTSLDGDEDDNVAQNSFTWVAIAFNCEQIMADGQGVACIYNSAQPDQSEVKQFKMGFKHIRPGDLQPDAQAGLSETSISIANGNLTCSFIRENVVVMKNYRPINEPHYIIGAYGSNAFDLHDARDYTVEKYDFTTPNN